MTIYYKGLLTLKDAIKLKKVKFSTIRTEDVSFSKFSKLSMSEKKYFLQLFNDLGYEFSPINDLKDNHIYCDFVLYPIYEFNSFIMISPDEIENLSKNYSSRLYILTLPKIIKYYNIRA